MHPIVELSLVKDSKQQCVQLPGGRRIVTYGWDGSLRLWDLESGMQIGKNWKDDDDEKAGVHNIALSPKGKTLVSGSHDGKVRLWDVETGKVVAKWTGHTGSVCWSGNGEKVLSGSTDGTASQDRRNAGDQASRPGTRL
jgi:WD40 repeat protein